MNTEINFKELWQKRVALSPEEKEIIGKAGKLEASYRAKLVALIALFVATVAGLALIWLTAQLEWLSSKLGTSLVLIAVVMVIINSGKMLLVLKRADPGLSSHLYLQRLLKLKQEQEFRQTTFILIYFILLSVGIALYMLEPCSKLPLIGRFTAYAATFAWIGFNWFYVRPVTIRKQNKKLDEMIQKLRELTSSLEAD